MAPSVQIIVITGNAVRKSILIKQFEELNIPFPVYYMPASTPENTASYLPKDTDLQGKRIICCAKSHIRAIEHAAYETATDFSIIMEDDASLHKSLFVPTVIELVTQWDTLLDKDSLMVSLGWLPCRNYSHYTHQSSSRTISCLPGSKLLALFAYGTQAYILKKSTASSIYPIIKKDRLEELKRALLEIKPPHFETDTAITSPDLWLNRLLCQTILFPQVVIEQDTESMLNQSDRHSEIWKKYFTGYESIHREYWANDS